MQPGIPQPFVVPPGSGRELKLIGVTHKLISQQTGGGYYLFESESDPERVSEKSPFGFAGLPNPASSPGIGLDLAIQASQDMGFQTVSESGDRLHVHTYEDEVVYVVQGAIQIRLGTGKLEASEGGVAHLPKGIPHALYNPLKTPLRILALVIPGGMEQFFDELESSMQDGSMDDAKHREISLKYGLKWLE